MVSIDNLINFDEEDAKRALKRIKTETNTDTDRNTDISIIIVNKKTELINNLRHRSNGNYVIDYLNNSKNFTVRNQIGYTNIFSIANTSSYIQTRLQIDLFNENAFIDRIMYDGKITFIKQFLKRPHYTYGNEFIIINKLIEYNNNSNIIISNIHNSIICSSFNLFISKAFESNEMKDINKHYKTYNCYTVDVSSYENKDRSKIINILINLGYNLKYLHIKKN